MHFKAQKSRHLYINCIYNAYNMHPQDLDLKAISLLQKCVALIVKCRSFLIRRIPRPNANHDIYLELLKTFNGTLDYMKVGDYTNTQSIQFLLNHLNNLKRLIFLRLDLKDNPGIFNIDELLKKLHCIETLEMNIKLMDNYIPKRKKK